MDGNATDDDEATILVPWEFCDDLVTGCANLISYNVYAVGLGKPNGYAIVTAECTFDEEVVGGDCTDTLLMGSFDVKRTNGGKTNLSGKILLMCSAQPVVWTLAVQELVMRAT
jgi:hypothetical protein